MLDDRNALYSNPEAFFRLEGSAVMILTPDAAAEVCRMAAGRGLVVGRVEGGIWHDPGFEPRHQCIWLGLWPPLDGNLSDIATSNDLGADFIASQNDYSAFIVTATMATRD